MIWTVKTRLLIVATAATLLLTACGAESTGAQTVTSTSTTTVSVTVKPEPPAPVTVTATATLTTEASAAPAPAPDAVARWGQPQAVSKGTATVAVYDVEIPADITGPEATQGLSWAAVDAELCLSGDSTGAQVSWSPWGLTAGSRNYEAVSTTYNHFPKPGYPVVEPVGPGECARGWIVFEAPADGSVTQVRYANPDLSGSSVEVVKWSITG